MTIDEIRKLAKGHHACVSIDVQHNGKTAIEIRKNGLVTQKTLEDRDIKTSPFDLVGETVKRMLRIGG